MSLMGNIIIIPLDKMLLFFVPLKVLIFFLILHKSICCGYSLEATWRGTSNDSPQHMFLWRNKKKCLPDTHSYLDL